MLLEDEQDRNSQEQVLDMCRQALTAVDMKMARLAVAKILPPDESWFHETRHSANAPIKNQKGLRAFNFGKSDMDMLAARYGMMSEHHLRERGWLVIK